MHYQCFETFVRKGVFNSLLFKKERVTAMSELLKETKWTLEDVSNAMKTPLFQRDLKGFIKPKRSLGDFLEIAELKGVIFDYNENSPSILVVVKPAKDGNGLLSYKDIIEILQLSSDEAKTISFSLDPPTGTEQYHPFMKMRCYPAKLQNTSFMHSLFHADYLLKFLSTGVEVSAEPPFDFKPIKDGLIKHLPDNIKFICRPPYLRGMSHMTSHRFWIEVEEIFYDEAISENKVSYYIGDVKLSVKSRPLVTSLNGRGFDAKHYEHGPHAQFAEEVTKHYKDISEYFPIFARVKELSKLQFVIQRLCNRLESLKKHKSAQFQSLSRELFQVQSLFPIKKCPDSCTWVPATFGNSIYGGMLFKPTSNLGGYFTKAGADVPKLKYADPAFSDVHDLLLQDVNPALYKLGGVCFKLAIQKQCRVDTSMFGPDLLCVRLRTVSVDNPGDHTFPEAMSDQSSGDSKQLQQPIVPDHVSSIPFQNQTNTSKTENTSSFETFTNKWGELNPTSIEATAKVDNESEVKSDHKTFQDAKQFMNTTTYKDERSAQDAASKRAVKSVTDHKSKQNSSQTTSETLLQNARLSPRLLNEYHIDLVMDKAAQRRIVLLAAAGPEHQPKDTLSTTVRQSLINQAVLGEKLEDPALHDALKTSYDFNETNFHPNVLARQQIKTAIVLRKFIELHIKQGTEEHIISSQ